MRLFSGLAGTIVLAVAGIAAFALGLIALLDLLNFSRDQAELSAARRRAAAEDLKAAAEAGLHLGMTLDQLPGARELSARIMRRSIDLVSIELVDETGVVRQSQDPSREGARRAAAAAPDAVDIRAPLVHNFGEPAGEVVLRFSNAGLGASRKRVRHGLAFALAAHLLVIALFTVGFARRVAADLCADALRAAARLAAEPEDAAEVPAGSLEAAAGLFAAATDEAAGLLGGGRTGP